MISFITKSTGKLMLKNKTSNILTLNKALFSVEIPKNILAEYISADKQPDNGIVYDKKPFKMHLEAGKRYMWCLCGHSKNQPFCDGTHRVANFRIKLKPIAFAVEKSKEYWVCNCKHTKNRPFCDGTHKQKVVEEQNSTIRQ